MIKYEIDIYKNNDPDAPGYIAPKFQITKECVGKYSTNKAQATRQIMKSYPELYKKCVGYHIEHMGAFTHYTQSECDGDLMLVYATFEFEPEDALLYQLGMTAP